MSHLEKIKPISSEVYNKFTVIMGKPGSSKTTVAGTWPKPMLVITIGDDGGAVVLKHYSDEEVKTVKLTSDDPKQVGAKHVGIKLKELLEELRTVTEFKTVVIDAYSSVEEEIVNYLVAKKGTGLSLQERGDIKNFLVDLRDAIVKNSSTSNVEYIAIVHVKIAEDTDNISGEKNINLIPKMSLNNGNILLERASNVMYCSRKTVKDLDKGNKVKFLTYVGAHPYIDTKIRFENGTKLESGVYIENCTYEDIVNLSKTGEKNIKKVDIVEMKSDNPFNETKEEDDF